jgi:hypothetical protein
LANIRGLSLSSLTDETAPRGRDAEREPVSPRNPSDPFAGEAKWPAWKVTVAVIVFCGAFWAGIIYLGMRLFGG